MTNLSSSDSFKLLFMAHLFALSTIMLRANWGGFYFNYSSHLKKIK
jgi:hypothetical protein